MVTRRSLTEWSVYHVLLHLHKRLPLGNFFRVLEDGGERLAPATRLLQVYAREQNREMLRDFYYSDDRRVESATLLLEEAGSMTDQGSKITTIKAAQKFLSEDKDHAFEAKVTISPKLRAPMTHWSTRWWTRTPSYSRCSSSLRKMRKGGSTSLVSVSMKRSVRAS